MRVVLAGSTHLLAMKQQAEVITISRAGESGLSKPIVGDVLAMEVPWRLHGSC